MTSEQLQELAESLQGSSGLYDQAFAAEYGVDQDKLDELLKDYVVRCSFCGWWECVYDLDEDENGDMICGDCYTEQDGDA